MEFTVFQKKFFFECLEGFLVLPSFFVECSQMDEKLMETFNHLPTLPHKRQTYKIIRKSKPNPNIKRVLNLRVVLPENHLVKRKKNICLGIPCEL